MSHQATHFSAIVPGLPLFWKPGSVGGIRLRSGKRPKVGERSGNMCIQGNLIVAALQNKLPILYSHCISFFVRDHRRLWINKCAFVQHIAWKESGKSCLFFSVWRVVMLQSSHSVSPCQGHCTNARHSRCQADLDSFALTRRLDETTGTCSFNVVKSLNS